MVRLAENVRLVFDPGTDGRSWLVLHVAGEDVRLRTTNELEFRSILRSSIRAPHKIAVVNDRGLWMFREEYFWSEEDLTQHEVQREIAWSLPTA